MIGKKPEQSNIEQLKKEIETWKSKYLRALADYQNLEKRIREQREEDVKYSSQQVIKKILPVIDALEQAEKNIKDPGLQLIIRQLDDILKGENVKKIEVVGKKFDPNSMECISVEESEKDGEVLEELRSGYTISDKLLRPVQVKVGKKRQINKF